MEAEMAQRRIATYDAFFLFYLREHSRPACRAWHYAGTTLVLITAAVMIAIRDAVLLPLLLVLGYGPAWIGHFFIEGNKPATFSYPLWSLVSDFRMYFLWLGGRLDPWLARAGGAARPEWEQGARCDVPEPSPAARPDAPIRSARHDAGGKVHPPART